MQERDRLREQLVTREQLRERLQELGIAPTSP
jgi:hypothetical protein